MPLPRWRGAVQNSSALSSDGGPATFLRRILAGARSVQTSGRSPYLLAQGLRFESSIWCRGPTPGGAFSGVGLRGFINRGEPTGEPFRSRAPRPGENLLLHDG